MKVIIMFSHDINLAKAAKDYLIKMVGQPNENATIEAIGGMPNNELGTDFNDLVNIVNKYPQAQQFYVFVDLGSALLSAETTIMMLAKENIHLSKQAFIENAFGTYVLALSGADHTTVLQASNETFNK